MGTVADLDHVHAMLQGVRRIAQIITRERSPDALVQKAVDGLVETRGLASAAILLEDPFGFRMGSAAGAGGCADGLAGLIAQGATPECVARARRGESTRVEDPAAQCAGCPAGREARERHVTVCVPVEWGGRRFGVLHAALPAGVGGDAEVTSQLGELAADVAFALRSIELESQVDRTQATLQSIDERLRALVAASPTAIVIFDTEGYVTSWNHGAERLFGWTTPEALARAGPFGSPEGIADARRLLERVIAGDLKFPLEERVLRKDGCAVDVSFSSIVLRTPDGAPQGLLCVFEDVTARRRAERALRESAEQYRTEFEYASTGRCLSTPDGRILRVNPALARMLGDDPERLAGRRVEEFIHPDDLAASRELGLELLAGTRSAFHLELRFLRADGAAVWMDLSSALYRGADGAPVHFITDVRDLTRRKVAEAQSARSQQRYQDLIESLDELVYAVAVDGRLTYVSGAVSKYGYAANEVLGRRFQEFAHPDDRATLERAFAERLEADVGPWEFRIFDGAGKVRTVRSSGRRVLEDGRMVGLAGVLVDLTAQRSTEDQLRAAQKMEAIGRLAGGVAHDFNNLLTVINSYARLAAKGLDAADRRRGDLEEVRKAGERAAALTRQLLAFSRRQVLQPVVLDLAALIGGMERMLVRLIGEDVRLRVLAEPGAGRIRADAGQVEQVLMNLAVNARDAMPDGGELTIETASVQLDEDFVGRHVGARCGPFVRLRVRDTGTGMDAETRERLFEPFFTTKPAGKGTGLGLATVYGIVKQSGGSIFVESTPGAGATFDVYLPRVEEETVAEEATVPAMRATGLGAGTILFVEDDEAIRALAGRVLSEEGYDVELAATGGEALVLAERRGRRIDLVVTDVIMPGMSGKELAEKLRPFLRDTPVLFMSGYGHDAISQHGILEPGTLFLPKPFTPEALVVRVRDVLDRIR